MSAELRTAERQLIALESSRPLYWFTVPAKLAKKVGVKKVALIELKAEEELMATNRAKDSGQVKLTFELAKESLRRADDQVISSGDGSSDTFWAQSTESFSQLRQLILSAYMKIHNAEKEDIDSFLESQTIQV